MPSAVRVLCLSLLALTAATPPAAADASWSVAPSGGGRRSFYAEGAPGTVLEDTVSVTNRGGRPLTVRLTGDGVPLAFAGRTVRIPARTRADVPFTVTVPASAAPGVRSGAVVARDPDGRTRTVPLRLRATGPELTALTVEHVTVDRDGIRYDLVNRGTVPLTPRLAIHADGVFGPLLDRPARPLDTTLPPASRTRLTEPWPDRPALDAVDVRLTVTAGDGTADTASASARFVPWGAVTGAAGALTAGVALGVVRRRGWAGLRGVRG
ncbi:COG1470 family protein [Streptomyces nigra]|uniref:COG1470 family protein n=1 Tax=Streptomyces nigra TaxID=1827580 RepID=UPI003412F02F